MAKKYLLYIHDERFAIEPEKSKLVNDLLDKHYGATGIAVIIVENKPLKLDSPAGRKAERDSSQKEYNFCKHNQVVGFCKHGCK